MLVEWTCLMALPYSISSPICRVFPRRNCVGGGWRRQRNAAAGNEIGKKLKLEAGDEWVRDDRCNSSQGSVGARSRIPIIALTAHSMKGDCERCLAAGMDAFVTKPIRASELFEAIESTCSATLQ